VNAEGSSTDRQKYSEGRSRRWPGICQWLPEEEPWERWGQIREVEGRRSIVEGWGVKGEKAEG